MDTERLRLKPILFLVAVLTAVFLSRMLLSPLLLSIEGTYGLTHAEGGALFLIVSAGYTVSMLLSGFVARWLTHRRTIIFSVATVGASLVVLGSTPPLGIFYAALALLGAGTGLYGPSGITMLTGVAQSQHWGKALALHEIGPILGFFLAPLLAELALRASTWQALFLAVGAACLGLAVLFGRFAEGGRFPGAPPMPRNVWAIWSIGRFWIIALMFVLAIGVEIGAYSMLPTFLVEERGLSSSVTNSLVSASRLTALLLVFSAGWLSDRFGARMLIGSVCIAAGAVTVAIGVASGPLLLIAVLLQPMLIAAFFPAGLMELARIAPAESRNLAVSLVIPLGNLFGAGVVPAGMGYLAERGMFGIGFVAIGALMLASMVFLPLLPGRRAE